MADPVPDSAPPRWHLPVVLAAVVIVLGRAVSFDFVAWDDFGMLLGNDLLHPVTPASLAAMWSGPVQGLYTPLAYTLWAAVTAVARTGDTLSPWPFHALNLLLHAGAAAAAYAILRRLTRSAPAALAGSLLFALHPLVVEPVAWIAGMNNLLAGMLSLVAIGLYLRSADAPKSAPWYAGCLLALLLALLSKPTAIVTPAVILAIDGLVLRRPWRTVLRWTVPLVLLAVPFVVVGRYAQAAEAVAPIAWPQRLLVAGDATGFYVLKLFWPWPLLMDYGRTPQAVIATGGSVAGWIALAGVGVAVAALAKRRPWIAGGAAVFVVGFAPVSGLVRFDYQQFSTVADRYVYLALLGPAMLLSIALSHRPRAALVAAGVIAIAAGTVSFLQAGVWRDSFTLARHTLQRNPDSLGAEMTLCYAHRRAGDWEKTVEHAQAVLRIHPGYTDVHLLLAQRLLVTGRPADAAYHFQQAIDHGYGDPSAYAGLASARLQQGRPDLAIAAANAVLAVQADHEQARTTLAYAQAASGDLAAAEQNFRRVLAAHPTSPLAARGLQRVLAARRGGP